MRISVPVLVEERDKVFHMRPLFHDAPRVSRGSLEAATASFVHELRRHLGALGRRHRHEAVAQLAFSPSLREERWQGSLALRRASVQARLVVLSFPALGRRVGVLPQLGDLRFAAERGEATLARAAEVAEAHLRRLEKEGELHDELLAALRRDSGIRTSLDLVDLEVSPPRELPRAAPRQDLLAQLGAPRVEGGAEELDRVGRCLDTRLFGQRPGACLFREGAVDELGDLLAVRDCEGRRPVLLLGAPKVGKTAVLEEVVRRRIRSRKGHHAAKGLTWLLSPQRLISGMSHVGQWEERLLAILREVRKKGHVLYVDDPVGLYEAGRSASSTLTAGQVLRPWVERGEVRVVVEATPETLRVLKETDRAFADMLHRIPVEEPTEEETLRILLGTVRELERDSGVAFRADALPACVDMVRRFRRHQAFPGKAVEVLRALARRHPEAEVGRPEVLAHFQETTGMQLHLLDPRRSYDAAAVTAQLGDRVVGQGDALGVMEDRVAVARARLDDPERPLGVLLFLGPTGVGKTECAKALATTLYGGEDRLVRFDMNQFVDPGAAARLVGFPGAPEGPLTAALRRQPFSVLLLDEIEKAHPAVLDLLLQALGEGRLSDARGRTADLTRTLVVMTSNLGVREADRTPGLVRDGSAAAAVFAREAERWFRPEFFNRIDRVVRFQPLSRDEITRVGGKLAEDILAREGLARRRTLLRIHPEALARAVDSGFDPRLGARALARSLEKNLALPAAERLAVLEPSLPAVVRVEPGQDGLEVAVDTLEEAEAPPLARELLDLEDVAGLAGAFRAVFERLSATLEALRPEEFEASGALARQVTEALQLEEALGSLRGRLETYERWVERPPPAVRVARPGVRGARTRSEAWARTRLVYRETLAALDVAGYLDALARRTPPPGDEPEERALFLARELALLDLRVRALERGGAERVTVEVVGLGGAGREARAAADALRDVLRELGLWVGEAREVDEGVRVDVGGPGGREVAALEEGVQLHVDREGRLRLVALRIVREDGGGGLGPVLRIHEAGRRIVDLRTRSLHHGAVLSPEAYRRCLVELLPLPEDLSPLPEEVRPS